MKGKPRLDENASILLLIPLWWILIVFYKISDKSVRWSGCYISASTGAPPQLMLCPNLKGDCRLDLLIFSRSFNSAASLWNFKRRNPPQDRGKRAPHGVWIGAVLMRRRHESFSFWVFLKIRDSWWLKLLFEFKLLWNPRMSDGLRLVSFISAVLPTQLSALHCAEAGRVCVCACVFVQ